MKRWKKMLILVICAAVLYGGYLGVQKLTGETETVSETTGSFPMTGKTSADVTGIRWTKSDVTYDFTKVDDTWQLTSDSAFPVDGSAVDTYVEKVIAQTGIRRVENVEKPADYGLETPAFTVELTYSDGTSAAFHTGDATPFGDGYYAMSSENPSTVYTVSTNLGTSFTKTIDSFAKLEEMPSFETADRVVIGTGLDLVKSGSKTQQWYVGEAAMDDSSVETLLSDIQSLSWSAYAGGADSKADFGIPEHSTITVYSGDEAVYSLCVSDPVDGVYYAYVPGAKAVYTMDSSVKNVLSTAVDSLRRMTLVLPSFEELNALTMTAGDDMLAWEKPSEGAETAAAEQEAAEAAWQQVTSLTASSHTVGYEAGTPVLTVCWTIGDETAEAIFLSFDADSYLLETADGAMLFPADKLDKLIRSIRYQ